MSRQIFVCCVILFGCIILLGLSVSTIVPVHAQSSSTPTPTPTPTRFVWSDSSTTIKINEYLVARYDPVKKIISLFPVDPSMRIIIAGQGDISLPLGNSEEQSEPEPELTPVPLDPASLRGKIIFKSTRDDGVYPDDYSYYSMNPDGSEVTRLDTDQTQEFLNVVQGLEGFSPDRSQVVLGETCDLGDDVTECDLYILPVAEFGEDIVSGDTPTQGKWFFQENKAAKDPVWSPRGDYLAFVANHESPAGCALTMNLFKSSPKQKPVIRRLTSYCAENDTGHPSFSPDGSQIVYWSQFPGPNPDIYVIDVGADDSFDWRMTQPKRITFESDNWDPIWVK